MVRAHGVRRVGGCPQEELGIPLVDTPPEVGDFLPMAPPESVRQRFAIVSGFTQRTPQDGAASQRIDVYSGYDARNGIGAAQNARWNKRLSGSE